MYSSKNTNPFYENGSDDDERSQKSPVTNNSMNDRRQQIMQQIDESEDRQLASTRRALASVYDSERMGIAAAEELIHQGEQLDNIERKNDEINKNLTVSQKHLNSIKSVFGGIKTWWTGDKQKPDAVPERQSALRKNIDESQVSQRSEVHPALRIRSEDGRGFYEDELDAKFMAGAKSQPRTGNNEPMFRSITKSDKERQMEDNLSLMSDGMSKLKGLALNMGTEISSQNDQLDRINTKVTNTDENIGDKNKQMRRILYK